MAEQLTSKVPKFNPLIISIAFPGGASLWLPERLWWCLHCPGILPLSSGHMVSATVVQAGSFPDPRLEFMLDAI